MRLLFTMLLTGPIFKGFATCSYSVLKTVTPNNSKVCFWGFATNFM